MFDLEKYRQTLHTQWLGQHIDYFDELASTNTYMKQLPKKQVSHGHLCLADYQSRGRGQYERKWQTEAGKNLTFTLAFKPPKAERFHVLALACARALVAQIEDSLGCQAFIKWPNDVIVQDKKVAGLLTETVFSGNVLDRLLIGIGLNVNQEHFPKPLKNSAISLKLINGKSVQRERFLSEFLARVEYQYVHWHKQKDSLLKFINKKIIGHGRWVQFQVNGRPSAAEFKLLGINQQGELTAVGKEGELQTFSYEQIRLITD